MNWDNQTPHVRQSFVYFNGVIRMSVSDAESDPNKRWQHFQFSFGESSPNSIDECKATWPREALALARKALDEFEATLEAE